MPGEEGRVSDGIMEYIQWHHHWHTPLPLGKSDVYLSVYEEKLHIGKVGLWRCQALVTCIDLVWL